MISSITNFLARNRRVFYYACFFLFIFSLTGDFTFADPKEVVVVDDAQKWWKFAGTINTALIWLSAIVWIVTYFITLFLEPGWINGTIFWLDVRFREVWILVSNVVYFIFAFLLIWIAFMNIIWKGQDKYQLKQALPKFIIWVLIVPFSLFFVQFILSISAILTVSALSLPFNTFQDIQKEIDTIKVPTKCYVNIKSVGSNKTADEKKDDKTSAAKKEKLSTEEKEHEKDLFWCAQSGVMWLWDSMDSTSFGLISIYTYGILGLDGISTIQSEDLVGKIETVWDLVIHVIFNVLFIVIYMVLIIALWLVLIVRWIYLWIYMMMSPVFWLMYFFDKNEGWWDGLFSKFNFKQLISLALVPVYVMLALSFGFLFIFVILQGVKDQPWEIASSSSGRVSISETGIRINDIWWNKDNDFELVVKWALSEKHREAGVQDSGYSKLWNAGLWIVWDLILKMLWVVVLWISVMSAMRSSDITKAIVEPLHSFGGQVWWLIAKSPQYLPIFKGQSMKSIENIGWKYWQVVQQTSIDRANEFAKTAPFLKWNADISSALSSIDAKVDNIPKWNYTDTLFREDYMAWMKAAKWDSTNMTSSAFLATAKKMWEKANIDTKWFNNSTEGKVIETIITKFEEKIDKTTGWLTDKVQNGVSTMWKNDLKKLAKDIYTGTATPASGTPMSVEPRKYNLNIEPRFFDEDWLKLRSDAIDNVARTVHDKIWSGIFTEQEYKKKLKKTFEDKDINKILKYIKEDLVAEGEKLFKDEPKSK